MMMPNPAYVLCDVPDLSVIDDPQTGQSLVGAGDLDSFVDGRFIVA